jgi:hypothetical protein
MGCEWQDLRLTVLRESPAVGKLNLALFPRCDMISTLSDNGKTRAIDRVNKI